MSSTFYREARWFLGNLALLLVLAFGFLLVAGSVQLTVSPEGWVGRGLSGPFANQVLLWSFGSISFAFVWFAPPILLIVLAIYRLLVRAIGHPRAVAGFVAAATASLDSLVPRADPFWFVAVGVASLAYAAILRLPGHSLGELATPVRGSVIGLSLSFAWLVGSLVAMVIAIHEYREGRQAAAGWILVAGCALPAVLFVTDLWRDDVPGLNYVITTAFV
ncbi:MAG: hypothetical protein QOE42_387, partial [Chloroflexota bacterium]|nr:hypothetical protein [Chloroflexota bacterium]